MKRSGDDNNGDRPRKQLRLDNIEVDQTLIDTEDELDENDNEIKQIQMDVDTMAIPIQIRRQINPMSNRMTIDDMRDIFSQIAESITDQQFDFEDEKSPYKDTFGIGAIILKINKGVVIDRHRYRSIAQWVALWNTVRIMKPSAIWYMSVESVDKHGEFVFMLAGWCWCSIDQLQEGVDRQKDQGRDYGFYGKIFITLSEAQTWSIFVHQPAISHEYASPINRDATYYEPIIEVIQRSKYIDFSDDEIRQSIYMDHGFKLPPPHSEIVSNPRNYMRLIHIINEDMIQGQLVSEVIYRNNENRFLRSQNISENHFFMNIPNVYNSISRSINNMCVRFDYVCDRVNSDIQWISKENEFRGKMCSSRHEFNYDNPIMSRIPGDMNNPRNIYIIIPKDADDASIPLIIELTSHRSLGVIFEYTNSIVWIQRVYEFKYVTKGQLELQLVMDTPPPRLPVDTWQHALSFMARGNQ